MRWSEVEESAAPRARDRANTPTAAPEAVFRKSRREAAGRRELMRASYPRQERASKELSTRFCRPKATRRLRYQPHGCPEKGDPVRYPAVAPLRRNAHC